MTPGTIVVLLVVGLAAGGAIAYLVRHRGCGDCTGCAKKDGCGKKE